eukprot:1737986-Pleurochrysis_carterae.AAC.2
MNAAVPNVLQSVRANYSDPGVKDRCRLPPTKGLRTCKSPKYKQRVENTSKVGVQSFLTTCERACQETY